MNKKSILILIALAAVAGVVIFGKQLLDSPTAEKATENYSIGLQIKRDTLTLSEQGNTLFSVLFDSMNLVKPGSYNMFDTLVARTELQNRSQLNYPANKNAQLKAIASERQTITDYLKKAGMHPIVDTLPLRQLVFRVILDSIRNGEKAGKQTVINKNLEIVHESAIIPPVAATKFPKIVNLIVPLLICAAILSLLALYSILQLSNKKTMAKRKKSESEEEHLKRAVNEMLGKNTAEAKYFSEVLSGHKNYMRIQEQLRPDGKPDTGELINNMKTAGFLTAGESKDMYELYELKEKVAAIKDASTTPQEKQQKLLQALQSFTKDEALKQHLKQAEDEGIQWQKMMDLEEKDLPAALQHMIRFYDDRYGNGTHKLSPVYAETLRRAQLDIPENFSAEDRFLKALYEKYKNLLDEVLFTWFAQQQSEEKVAEARQAFVNRLAQLAFHAHSFLTHYNRDTAALPPATIKANMQMILNDGTVPASLNKDAYRTYSRDITRFEREIFLQKLLTGIGVNNLENVLVKDVYYPKGSL